MVPVKGKFPLKPLEGATGEGGGTSSNSSEKGGELKATQITMERLAEWVAGRMNRPVLDMTGITGFFDLNLKYSIERDNVDPEPGKYPVLPLALQEQLGLRLEKRTAPIDLLVVDRAEKVPVGN